jgi:MHS family proline/betaine transporter-like MFS transporter
MGQSFCSAGEPAGGAIFVLEQTAPSKRTITSSFYDISTIGGILLASSLVMLLSGFGEIERGWRLLFWSGSIPAFLGLWLRLKAEEGKEFTPSQNFNFIRLLRDHRGPLLSILFASGFSYTTYSLAFTLMNGYVPLVTSLTKDEVIQVNTWLLLIDLLLLPCFGYLSSRLGKERVMRLSTLSSAIGALPLFFCLQDASLEMVIFVRLMIVILGVAFGASYYAWAIEQVPASYRYSILALGGALGTQLIGAPCSSICLWLFQKTGWVASPGIYLIVTALLAGARFAKIPEKVIAK